MGLAASQARFLAITARKMNCEFESMQIAQDKLSVTRDLQKVSEEYQNSLNATKLVWDTADNDVYNLSYAAMMTPSTINEYNAYMLTDSSGKIVLSSSMFKAALNAGIINENGDPTGRMEVGNNTDQYNGTFNAFLYQLGVQNQISTETINGIQTLPNGGYRADCGVGGALLDKSIANVMNTNSFISYMKEATYGENYPASDHHYKGQALDITADMKAYGLLELFSSSLDIDGFTSGTDPVAKYAETTVNCHSGTFTVTKDGHVVDKETLKNLTLGDLLDGNYVLTAYNIGATDFYNSYAKTILGEMDELLGGAQNGTTPYRGLYVDGASNGALEEAYSQVDSQIQGGNAESISSPPFINSAASNTINKTGDSFHIVTTHISSGDISSISLTNMLLSYITTFAINLDGYDTGLYVDQNNPSKSTFFTENLSYQFIVDPESNVTDTDLLNADFYNQIYNNICLYGCSTDSMMQQKVTDEEYLNYALKNGQLFISSLNTDGYFYSDHYTLNGHVAEVQDDDAIAQAEAEYNIKKSKLDYKEQTLELKMKNIDTELSALTTEYDTVKNLISKNVEKVFTMFST